MEAEDLPRTPYSREAEEAVLGAVLINPGVWSDVSFLNGGDFHIHRHRWIWEALAGLQGRRVSIDVLTVAEELERAGKLAECGGPAFLTRLVNSVPDSLHALHYAGILRDRAIRRQRIAQAGEMATEAFDLNQPVAGALLADPYHYSTWADIQTGPLEYSWKAWLVNGLLTLLVSYSGDGKSLLALRLCGSFINGQSWPDGAPFEGRQGKVLWVECEAAQALNLLRANIFRYPLDSILTALDDPLEDVNLDSAEQRTVVEQRAGLPEVQFIVIDSLSGSSHRKENETGIKDITLWAARLARGLNKPLLMVHHLGKKKEWDSEEITLERVRGSSAIVQFARIVWALSCPDPTNRQTKRLEQIKNNLGRFPEAIGMTATEQGLEFGTAPALPRVETATGRAGDLLLSLLASGPMKQADLTAELDGAGISLPTAKRAKAQLGIVSFRIDNAWYWSLAPSRTESARMASNS